MHGPSVVLLSTHGRRSGRLRKSSVMRAEHEGAYVAVASRGGVPTNPSWFGNLRAHPLVGPQDGVVRRPVCARALSGTERERWWAVAAFPAYAGDQARTSREISVVLLSAV
jgi:F420H(2)-dependent quinone reductase